MSVRNVFLVFTFISLVACGGGGSAGSVALPVGSTEVDWDEALFPTTSDLRWSYIGGSGLVSAIDISEEYGTGVVAYSHKNAGVERYKSNDSGLYYHGFVSTDILVSGLGRYLVNFKLPTGLNLVVSEQSKVYRGTGTAYIRKQNSSDSGADYEVDYQLTTYRLSDEEVTVPFGTFQTKRLRFQLTTTAQISGNNVTASFSNELWLAKNIGVVKRIENNNGLLLSHYQGDDGDGDGIMDRLDEFPDNPLEASDTDGDGIGNNADNDDDNDGTLDELDDAPLDAKVQVDIDGNGIDDRSLDADGDGISNDIDPDDDNDGVNDDQDAFPINSNESTDSDNDGIGNNEDSDDDNDGVLDAEDAFPLDPDEIADLDNDGIGDNSDLDIDGDGILNEGDEYPLDQSEYLDTDFDGIGNNADLDDDGDLILDTADYHPLKINIPKKLISTEIGFAVLYEDGSVLSWASTDVILSGNSSSNTNKLYVDIPNLNEGVLDIYANDFSFSAHKADGTIHTWGPPGSGGGTIIEGVSQTISQVITTDRAFAAILVDGSVVTWGDVEQGGNSADVDFSGGVKSIKPVNNNNNQDFHAVFVAQKNDNSYVVWGNQQMTDEINEYISEDVVDIMTTESGAYALLRSDGSVVSWGRYNTGAKQLNGEFVFGDVELTNVKKIFSNGNAFAALKNDDTVDVWGNGNYGANIKSGISDIKDIFSSPLAFSAIKKNGSAITWGWHATGQSDTVVEIASEAKVIFPTDIGYSFVTFNTDGEISSWGRNQYNFNSLVFPQGIIDFYIWGVSVAILTNGGDIVFYPCQQYCDESDLPVSSLLTNILYVKSAQIIGINGFAALRQDKTIITWGGEEISQKANSIFIQPEN